MRGRKVGEVLLHGPSNSKHFEVDTWTGELVRSKELEKEGNGSLFTINQKDFPHPRRKKQRERMWEVQLCMTEEKVSEACQGGGGGGDEESSANMTQDIHLLVFEQNTWSVALKNASWSGEVVSLFCPFFTHTSFSAQVALTQPYGQSVKHHLPVRTLDWGGGRAGKYSDMTECRTLLPH